MENRQSSKGFGVKAAVAGLAAFFLATLPSRAQDFDYKPSRGKLLVGAGATTYLAQESPSTGMALDARYEYRMTSGLALEGTALTAFSESVNNEGTTIPVLLEGALKMRALPMGTASLFGAAGMGYGAFLGTEELQDGATFTLPLSLGIEWQAQEFGLAPRFTYRPIFGDELGADAEADADSWTAVLDVQLPFL